MLEQEVASKGSCDPVEVVHQWEACSHQQGKAVKSFPHKEWQNIVFNFGPLATRKI